MALFRNAGLAAGISGRLGGVEFVQGPRGPYIRKAQLKIRRESERAIEVRAFTSLAISAWQELTDDDKEGIEGVGIERFDIEDSVEPDQWDELITNVYHFGALMEG